MALDTKENLFSMLSFGSINTLLPIPIAPAITFQEPDLSDLLGLYREIELETIDRYSSKAELDNLFGINNVNIWADLDNTKNSTAKRARMIAMMVKADSIIDAKLRDGPYKVPFVPPYPRTIINLSTRLAGFLLYEHRGITDSAEQKHELNWHGDYVDKVINWILSRKWRLDYALSTVRTHIPAANGVTIISGGTLDEDVQPNRYCVKSDVEAIYGLTNIVKWADLNNNKLTSEVDTRIDKFIDLADNEINCRMRAGPYKIPFIVEPYEGILVDLSARLTGALLYECRGPTNADPKNDLLKWHRDQVDKTIDGIMVRRYRFDPSKSVLRKTTPLAV